MSEANEQYQDRLNSIDRKKALWSTLAAAVPAVVGILILTSTLPIHLGIILPAIAVSLFSGYKAHQTVNEKLIAQAEITSEMTQRVPAEQKEVAPVQSKEKQDTPSKEWQTRVSQPTLTPSVAGGRMQ